MEPMSPDSPISGLTIACRTVRPDSGRPAVVVKNARRSAEIRPWIPAPSSTRSGTMASGSRSWTDVVRRASALSSRGYRITSAISARNIVRAWSSKRDQRGVQLRRVLQDPARLVEQLELLVLLAFGQVRPVREEDRHERDQQEQDGARVDPHDGHRKQRKARVRQRHDQPELEHLGQLLELRRAARQRDRGRDGQRTDHDRDEHRGEGGQPVDGAGRAALKSRCGGTPPGSRPR